MGYQKFKELEFVYEYDFSTDGGSVGVKTLRALGNALSSDLVITEVHVFSEIAFNGTATPTVVLGNSVDDDGYLANFYSLVSTISIPVRNGEVAGVLLWDDTNDHEISYKIPSSAAAVPIMTIGTQALTAGKAKFVFKCVRY